MQEKTVLLIGATGLVGGACLQMLRAETAITRIIVLTRRKLELPEADPKIEEHLIDFDQLEQVRDSIRADAVISALGTTMKKAQTQDRFYQVDFTYVYQIAQLAQSNGARHLLLVSSMGANPDSRIFYNRVKGELEAAVQRLGFESVSIFRPSLLLGERSEKRPSERIAQQLSKLLSFLAPAKYKPIAAPTVAHALVTTVLSNPVGVQLFESDAIRRMAQSKLNSPE